MCACEKQVGEELPLTNIILLLAKEPRVMTTGTLPLDGDQKFQSWDPQKHWKDDS